MLTSKMKEKYVRRVRDLIEEHGGFFKGVYFSRDGFVPDYSNLRGNLTEFNRRMWGIVELYVAEFDTKRGYAVFDRTQCPVKPRIGAS